MFQKVVAACCGLLVFIFVAPAFAVQPITTPAAKQIMADSVRMLENHKYDELERTLTRYLEKQEKIEDGQWKFHIALDGIAGKVPEFAGDAQGVEKAARLVTEWAAKDKRSELAKTALAASWIARAWVSRGGNYASETSDQQFVEFDKGLRSAYQVLKTIETRGGVNPEFYVQLLAYGLGAGFPPELLDEIHQAGISAFPDYFYITSQYLVTKFERWSGDSLALPAALKRLSGRPEPFARAMWHLYLYGERDELKKLKAVEAGKAGFRLLREKYQSPVTENEIAYLSCCVWKDKAMARDAVSRIGSNPDLTLWGSVDRYNCCNAWSNAIK